MELFLSFIGFGSQFTHLGVTKSHTATKIKHYQQLLLTALKQALTRLELTNQMLVNDVYLHFFLRNVSGIPKIQKLSPWPLKQASKLKEGWSQQPAASHQ